MYSRDKALFSSFFEPSGLKVNSLFPRVLNFAYSAVANKFVALAPIAKIPAIAKTPKDVKSGLNSFSFIAK